MTVEIAVEIFIHFGGNTVENIHFREYSQKYAQL